MKLFQLLPKKLYDFACNLPRGPAGPAHGERRTKRAASVANTPQSTETQGMGTGVRRNAPNGEAPRPLRSFVSSWRRSVTGARESRYTIVMNAYPELRLRRVRRTAGIRALFDLEIPGPAKWCWPMFVVPGTGIKEEIASMPGQFHWSVDRVCEAVEPVVRQGIGSVLLFGQTDRPKDNGGSSAWDDRGVVQQAVRALKRAFPGLTVMTDVCLCAYTSHGHCAPLRPDGSIDNDAACDCLAKVALSHAAAGADVVAPSAMMDGQIAAIRAALAENAFDDTLLMAYSTKFASACYGPFRDAEGSAPQPFPGAPTDRKGYQASFANPRNALLESALDEQEGADILMVKPALFYTDMIAAVKARTLLPVAAYNVSGEYSMLIATARAGWGDLRELVRESTLALTRAGTDLIISYWANRYDELLA